MKTSPHSAKYQLLGFGSGSGRGGDFFVRLGGGGSHGSGIAAGLRSHLAARLGSASGSTGGLGGTGGSSVAAGLRFAARLGFTALDLGGLAALHFGSLATLDLGATFASVDIGHESHRHGESAHQNQILHHKSSS